MTDSVGELLEIRHYARKSLDKAQWRGDPVRTYEYSLMQYMGEKHIGGVSPISYFRAVRLPTIQ